MNDLFIAKVANYNSTTGSTLILPGTTTATTKRYKRLYNSSVSTDSMVLVAKVSGTYVIIGRIV